MERRQELVKCWNKDSDYSDLFPFYLTYMFHFYLFHAKQPGPLGDFGVWHRQVVGVDLGESFEVLWFGKGHVWAHFFTAFNKESL